MGVHQRLSLEVGMSSFWTRNIMTCVETPRISILWEGERIEYFNSGRGIRQGDPISPHLFVLCMERLSHLIQKEVEENWTGIKVSRKGPILSHLFFADDMVLFSEANEGQLKIIKACLKRFYTCSSQKVTLENSQICFSNNVNDFFFVGHLARKEGIPFTKDLGRYL